MSSLNLLFFHIGRTGGTSLSAYLASLARNPFIQHDPGDNTVLNSSIERSDFDFISGHYYVLPWIHRFPENWRTLLVLRDPIAHLMSSYWHIRTHKDVPSENPVSALITATRSREPMTFFNTRMKGSFATHFDNPQTRFVLGKPRGLLDKGDLKRAMAVLDNVSYLGTTDRLTQLAAVTVEGMGWTPPDGSAIPRLMTNPYNRRNDMPRKLVSQLMALSDFDDELYRVAGARPNQATAIPHERDSDVSRVRGENALSVADLFRVGKIVSNAKEGSLQQDGDRLQIHPPPPDEEPTTVLIEDVLLRGHSELTGTLEISHPNGADTVFEVDIEIEAEGVLQSRFRVAASRPLHISLRFPSLNGLGTIRLRTAMADGRNNAYAWANFVGLTLQ